MTNKYSDYSQTYAIDQQIIVSVILQNVWCITCQILVNVTVTVLQSDVSLFLPDRIHFTVK